MIVFSAQSFTLFTTKKKIEQKTIFHIFVSKFFFANAVAYVTAGVASNIAVVVSVGTFGIAILAKASRLMKTSVLYKTLRDFEAKYSAS